jgi:tripartite-type tricarboxylate transporter receptor subunit TctC
MAALFKMIVAASILIAAQMAGGVYAQTLEEFFKSRPFTIVVGYPPGAAYDMYARLIARRLGHYLPGTPTVVVQNMPGAGSLSAANHLYNVARRDGSIIGTFSRGITMPPIIDSTGVRYDTLKFNWIGSRAARSASPLRGMTAESTRSRICGPADDGPTSGRARMAASMAVS